MLRRWEYRHEFVPARARREGSWGRFLARPAGTNLVVDVARLNELGSEGWELVSIEPETKWSRWGSALFPLGTQGYHCLFKRPLPPDY